MGGKPRSPPWADVRVSHFRQLTRDVKSVLKRVEKLEREVERRIRRFQKKLDDYGSLLVPVYGKALPPPQKKEEK